MGIRCKLLAFATLHSHSWRVETMLIVNNSGLSPALARLPISTTSSA